MAVAGAESHWLQQQLEHWSRGAARLVLAYESGSPRERQLLSLWGLAGLHHTGQLNFPTFYPGADITHARGQWRKLDSGGRKLSSPYAHSAGGLHRAVKPPRPIQWNPAVKEQSPPSHAGLPWEEACSFSAQDLGCCSFQRWSRARAHSLPHECRTQLLQLLQGWAMASLL